MAHGPGPPVRIPARTSLHGCFGRASRRVREAAPAKPAPSLKWQNRVAATIDLGFAGRAWCHQRRTASGWQAQPRTDQRGCPVRVLRRKTQRVMTRSQAIDMQGKRFERLLVVCRAGTDRCGNATWVCRCVCSTETIVTGANLRNGSTRSCGCLNRDLTIERNKGFVRHGHARRSKKTCEYTSLQNALYGKRATVCKRWRNSFPAFLADMGRKPSPAHRLKRLDTSKGYTQANCVWLKTKRPPKRSAFGENQPGQERIHQARRAWYATAAAF